MKEHELRGFVISRKKLGDDGLILTIYTKELGKVSIVAKGIKKPSAKLRSLVEPLIESEYRIVGHSKLPVLIGVKPLSSNLFYSAAPEKKISALLLTEIIDKLTIDGVSNYNLYREYRDNLKFLIDSDKELLIVSYAVLGILKASGLEPYIEFNDKKPMYLNLSEGTINGSRSGQQSIPIDRESAKLWVVCMSYDQSILSRVNVRRDILIDSVDKLTHYIEYSINKKIKSTKVLFSVGSF